MTSKTSPKRRREGSPGTRRAVPEPVNSPAVRSNAVFCDKKEIIRDKENAVPKKMEDSNNFNGGEWVKRSWRKGEHRQEIKLISETSALSFEEARVVALRLFNHYRWLSQLKLRKQRLRGAVARERRLSLSAVVRETVSPTQKTSRPDNGSVAAEKSRHRHVGSDEGPCSAELKGLAPVKHDFNLYVRGICALCGKSDFDDVLSLLFGVYSSATYGSVISFPELARILDRHFAYYGFDDPDLEKERLYRWLKRRFIDLVGVARGEPSLATKSVAASVDLPPTTRTRARANEMFITWDQARDTLHRAPHKLGELVAIDLPRLSRDMWSEDLEDERRIGHGSD